jgi:hypothetical protein
VPHESCGCGFWAYWALGDKQVSTPAVAGIIKGYGEVIEGELGFRASHAKIAALFPLVYSTELALALEDSYGADVYHSFQAMLEMNPAPAGQPPLTDDYFSRRRVEAGDSSFTYKPPKPAVSAAFRKGATACPKCGTVACAPGQKQCVACDIADLTQASAKAKTTMTEASRKIRELSEQIAKDIAGGGLKYNVGGIIPPKNTYRP